jgi:hypothetical protein
LLRALAVLTALALAACGTTQPQPPPQPSEHSALQANLDDPPTWERIGDMMQGRLLPTATSLGDGRVLVAGGFNPTAELYDPANRTWSRTTDSRTTHRYHTATRMGDGQVLVAGGEENWQTGITAEVYDPATSQWRATSAMVTFRSRHAAVLLRSGKVLVVGGTGSNGGVLASAELYDPATDSWSPAGSLATARSGHTATLLESGKVLVAGGRNGSGRLASAELYDPASGAWTVSGSMSLPRGTHTATLLSSGKVLVAGSDSPEWTPAASAELYDPATGTWTATGAMSVPRRFHTATRLPSGQVLVAGGHHEYTGITFSAELYDPAAGTWSPTASMNVDRYGHAAALLQDGSVLAVGGFSNHAPSSTELFGSGPRDQLPSGTSLLLEVLDGAGNPLSTAAISSQNAQFPTDSSGHLLFENLQPGRFLARVDAPGFTSASVALDLHPGAHVGHRVKLLPLGTRHLLQAEAGGVVDTESVRVTLFPGSVVDALGQPVTGPIEVTVVPLDPGTQLDSMPGPLEGTSPASGERFPLESFFMAEVSLWRNGAPLQLASGSTALLEFVLPEAVATRFHEGDTIPAWWFDLEAGLWHQEGLGTVQPSSTQPGTLTWAVYVSHFTWWNSDDRMPTACADVQVVDSHGKPVPSARVTVVGTSYRNSHERLTGGDGRVCVPIKTGGTATLYAGTLGAPRGPLVSVTGGMAAAACGGGACTPVTLVAQERICMPGAFRPCAYSGPAGTLGQGVCRAGLQRCDIVGAEWSACQGEVLPAAAESCGTPFDDNCDGRVNETCVCPVAPGVSCYTGPAGTLGVGRCTAGVTGCDASGAAACLGQRLPMREDCSTPEDDDCDGSTACEGRHDVLSLGGTGTDDPLDVALDSGGNTLLLGRGEGSLTLQGPKVTLDPRDLFVAKFGLLGEHLWHVPIRRADFTSAASFRSSKDAITVDGAGNVLVASSFVSQVSIGGTTRTSPSQSSLIIVKLSPTGSLLWAQAFHGSATASAWVTGITTNASGDIVVAGNFEGDLRFGDQGHPDLGGLPFYVLKLDGNTGAPIWSKVYRNGSVKDVSLDEDQNVLLAGDFVGTTLELDGTRYSNGAEHREDGFIAKLNATTGAHFWSMQIVNTGYSPHWLTGAARADGLGNVLLLTEIDMFQTQLRRIAPNKAVSMFKSRINGDLPVPQIATGTHVHMEVDAAGNTWLSGTILASRRPNNAFVLKYDKHGNPSFGTFGPTVEGPPGGTARGGAMAIHPNGSRVFVGQFQGTVDLGAGPVTSRMSSSGVSQDIFVRRTAP